MSRRALATRLAGRAVELAVLDGVLDAAIAERRGRVVLIGGEAGVGKSRLLRAVGDRGRRQGFMVVRGWCIEHGAEVLPLSALVDVVREIVEQVPSSVIDELMGVGRDDLAVVVPGLAGHRRRPGRAETGSPGRVFEATRGLLRRLSLRQPVLALLEDVQWADSSTCELIEYLVPRLSDAAVVLVMTYRDDDPDTSGVLRSLLGRLERSARPDHIELEPLSPAELAELVEDVTGTRPDPATVNELHVRSGGNPFFAEELLGISGADEIPATVRNAVVAHLERLDDDAKATVQIAALVGPLVDLRVIAAASGRGTAATRCAADSLVAAALWIADPGGLRFRHDLVRQVITQTMPSGALAEAHAALAGAHEAVVPDRFGDIARHWRLAGDDQNALRASIDAGRAATRRGAAPEALLQLELALELWTRVPNAASPSCGYADLLAEAADAAGQSRRFRRAVELGTRAADAWAAVDPIAEGATCLRVSDWAWFLGEPATERALVERAIARIPADPPTGARALAVAHLGMVLRGAGQSDAAGARCREAIALARASGSGAAHAHALATIGLDRCLHGDVAGLDTLRAAIDIAARDGSVRDVARGYVNLTHCLELFGQHLEVIAVGDDAHRFCIAEGIQRFYGIELEVNVLRSLQRLGRWDELDTRVERMRSRLAGDDGLPLAVLAGTWGLTLLRRGITTDVEQMVRVGLHRASADLTVLGPTTITALTLAAATHDTAAAIALVDDALDRLLPGLERDATELVAHAVGLVADQSTQRRTPAHPSPVHHHAAAWVERVTTATRDPRGAGSDLPAWRLQAQAELTRLVGAPAVDLWDRLVGAWDRLGFVYEAANARHRLVEARLAGTESVPERDRSDLTECLRTAFADATDLGALPLIAQIEATARRARLTLNDSSRVVSLVMTATVVNPLTMREREVLRLVTQGWSNGDIGRALYISRKTASVHVSNILRKLGVATRSEAAAVGLRAGLLDPP